MSEKVDERTHHFHAEATILGGSLRLPLVQEITPQAHVLLGKEGGYFSDHAEKYRLEGVISFKSAYTHVAGNRSLKSGKGWSTLTTTAIEGLNVLEILTADRIVGQTITEHPLEGYVPRVCFLGTRFENLRIAGHPITPVMNFDILGGKPENDAAYALDAGVISRVKSQYARTLKSEGLSEELREYYHRLDSTIGAPEVFQFSLVDYVIGDFPGRSHGPVLDIPDFGKVTLARGTVGHVDYKNGSGSPKQTTIQLTMLDLQMGCAGDGNVPIASGSTNGESNP